MVWAIWEEFADIYRFRPQIFLLSQSKCLQSCRRGMCGGSLHGWVSVMRQYYKVYSTGECFYLFSRRALLRWNGLPGGSRPVLVGDLAGNIQRKTAQFIWLSHRLSLSWEIGICIICFQCQHWLPGTAAWLGRALWWVENQRSTQELLITADRQMGFWRATHGPGTPVKCEYFTVSLAWSRYTSKPFGLFWHRSVHVWLCHPSTRMARKGIKGTTPVSLTLVLGKLMEQHIPGAIPQQAQDSRWMKINPLGAGHKWCPPGFSGIWARSPWYFYPSSGWGNQVYPQ